MQHFLGIWWILILYAATKLRYVLTEIPISDFCCFYYTMPKIENQLDLQEMSSRQNENSTFKFELFTKKQCAHLHFSIAGAIKNLRISRTICSQDSQQQYWYIFYLIFVVDTSFTAFSGQPHTIPAYFIFIKFCVAEQLSHCRTVSSEKRESQA